MSADDTPRAAVVAAGRLAHGFGSLDAYQRDALRWTRLLFERLRLRRPGLASLADQPAGGATPSATLLAGARDDVAALDGQIQATGEELFARAAEPGAHGAVSPLGALQGRFGLDPMESRLLTALSVYQVDRSLRELRPGAAGTPRLSIGTLVELVSATMADRRAALRRLRPDGSLRRYGLVQTGQADQGPGFDGRGVEVHERVVEFLDGQDGFDPRLAATSSLQEPDFELEELPVPEPLRRAIVSAYQACSGSRVEPARRRLALVGPDEGLKAALLAGLAAAYSRPLMLVRMGAISRLFSDPERSLVDHLREGVLQEAVLFLDAHDLADLSPRARAALSAALATADRPIAVGFARAEAPPLELEAPFTLTVPLPDVGARERLWRHFLGRYARTPPEPSVSGELSRRFVLGYEPIRRAALEVATSQRIERRRGAIGVEEASAVARRHQTHQLGRWAHRVECRHDWEDLILDEATRRLLRRVIQYVEHHTRVFDAWGFGRRESKGRGLTVLFHGEPGTGKTMAASVIARALDKDLFKVDLSKVTSKWVGETEKHLDEVFEQARAGGAILLFDEADSLFARRTEVRTSGDRYANLSVGFLLQRLEEYDGVSVLTTNRAESLDEAFRRRIRFHVEFPLPDEAQRLKLWRSLIPPDCPLDPALELELLAEAYDLGGGNIRNATLRAAFAAAAAGTPLSEQHLRDAADEEYRSLGRLVRRAADGASGDGDPATQ